MAKKSSYKKGKESGGKRRRRPRKKGAQKRRRNIAFRLNISEEPLYPMHIVDEDGEDEAVVAEDEILSGLQELPAVPTIRR